MLKTCPSYVHQDINAQRIPPYLGMGWNLVELYICTGLRDPFRLHLLLRYILLDRGETRGACKEVSVIHELRHKILDLRRTVLI